MSMNEPTIKTVIDPEDRLNFGPEWLTLPGFMAFEHCLYNLARDMVEGYNGGLWDFYRLSNGIRFIQFGEDNARFHLTSPNYADHEIRNYHEARMLAPALVVGSGVGMGGEGGRG